MKSVSIELSEKLHQVEIHTFSDLHIGDVHCNMKKIKERLEDVLSKPNAYVVLNGDIMNNATKTSISDSYAEEIPPMEQLQRFVELFEPLAKDGRILGATSGNHENRTYNKEGIDLTYLAMKQLGIQERYAKEGLVMFVRFGNSSRHGKERKICYSIYATHGAGGGRRPGAKINRLEEMQSIISCDVYIHGHTHCPIIFKSASYMCSPTSNSVYQMQHLFVNSSSMLESGGYGQEKEFKPSSLDCPIVYLYDGREKKAEAKL